MPWETTLKIDASGKGEGRGGVTASTVLEYLVSREIGLIKLSNRSN